MVPFIPFLGHGIKETEEKSSCCIVLHLELKEKRRKRCFLLHTTGCVPLCKVNAALSLCRLDGPWEECTESEVMHTILPHVFGCCTLNIRVHWIKPKIHLIQLPASHSGPLRCAPGSTQHETCFLVPSLLKPEGWTPIRACG